MTRYELLPSGDKENHGPVRMDGNGSYMGGTPCGPGYPMGTNHIWPGQLADYTTAIVRMDGEIGIPACVLLQGARARLASFDIYGRKCPLLPSATPLAGTRAKYGIAVEGRNANHGGIATGKHRVQDVNVAECWAALGILGGYWNEEGTWVPCEIHADQSHYTIRAFHCDNGVYCENQQSVANRLDLHFEGPKGVGINAKRGFGLIGETPVTIESPDFTLLRVEDFSPNIRTYKFDIFRDGFDFPNQRLTLFEYAGGAPHPSKKWSVKITGTVTADWRRMNSADLIKLNGVPGDRILIDVDGLPDAWLKKWKRVGQWYQMVEK